MPSNFIAAAVVKIMGSLLVSASLPVSPAEMCGGQEEEEEEEEGEEEEEDVFLHEGGGDRPFTISKDLCHEGGGVRFRK